jgi:hypothetical protein
LPIKKAGRRAKEQIHQIPSLEWRKSEAARLPQFEPHDVNQIQREVIKTSKANEIGRNTVLELRRRNQDQLATLLKAIELDTTGPDKWERAFFALAHIHHGVGCFIPTDQGEKVRARGPNRNASGWEPEQDTLLHRWVLELNSAGKSELAAIKEIASDPVRWKQLPHRKNETSTKSEINKRVARFKSRWLRVLKKRAEPGSLLELFVGDYPVKGSEADQSKWVRMFAAIPPKGVVKI